VSLAIWGWQRFIALGEQKFSRSQALQWALIASTAAALIGMGLLASWSRGGWLGAVVGVAFVVIFRSRHAMILSAVGGLLAIIALMMGMGNPNLLPAAIVRRLADLPAYFGVGLMEVVEQPVTDENFAVIERLAHWIAALRMLEISPWIGVGPGNYATVYPEVMLPRWQDPLGHAHNIYLNVLAESGLLGLATYLFLWIGAFAWIWQRQRSVPAGSWESALQIGVLGVLLHLSVHNFFDNLFVRGIYLHIAFWLAVVCVVEPGGTDKVDQTTGVKI
jgi:putative inorganic carbon (hco3(-)) transporter